MDAAAKPPGMGSRRLPQPDPPRHPTDSMRLPSPSPLPLFQAGAGLQALHTHTPHTTGMLCCPRFRYGGVDMIISASE